MKRIIGLIAFLCLVSATGSALAKPGGKSPKGLNATAAQELKDAGVWLVGTSDRGSQSLYEVDLKGPLAIVMGAEGAGLRRLTEEKCDFLVQIPMKGRVECLNVSVATGVCLFEALRQRETVSSSS